MYSPFAINLKKVYTSPFPYEPGFEVALDNGKKLFKFVQYNDGDGDIPGLRGRISYRVVADDTNVSEQEQVTCDLTEGGTVLGQAEFAGVLQPDVVLNGEGCWAQIIGPGEVDMWASIAAINRDAAAINKWLSPAAAATTNITGDGIVATAAAGFEMQIFAELLANVDGTPLAVTNRALLCVDAGTSTQFVVGETINGVTSSDTALVVERLRRGSTDYGVICSTLTATYFHTAAENLNSAAAVLRGILSCKGVQVPASNYRLIRK